MADAVPQPPLTAPTEEAKNPLWLGGSTVWLQCEIQSIRHGFKPSEVLS